MNIEEINKEVDKIEWDFSECNQKRKRRALLTVLGDPHLYLLLVVIGIMCAMTIVSCAYSGKPIERAERNFDSRNFNK